MVSLAAGTLFLVRSRINVACLICCRCWGLGDLRFNLNPASIFLEDWSSMSVGFILSISVHFTQKSSAVFSLVAALLILGLPIFDLGMAIVRRAFGKRIYGRSCHIHHILLRKATHKINPYCY